MAFLPAVIAVGRPAPGIAVPHRRIAVVVRDRGRVPDHSLCPIDWGRHVIIVVIGPHHAGVVTGA
jgi:mannitol/fructose-specific phosphotransferase system IIA component (Ntr-type)